MSFKDFLRKLLLACLCAVLYAFLFCLIGDFMGINDLTAYAVDVVLTPQQTAALV